MTPLLLVFLINMVSRDGKMYKRASNALIIFFIVLVKSVTNSTLFCCKLSNVANLLFFGDTYDFQFSKFLTFTLKRGKK